MKKRRGMKKGFAQVASLIVLCISTGLDITDAELASAKRQTLRISRELQHHAIPILGIAKPMRDTVTLCSR